MYRHLRQLAALRPVVLGSRSPRRVRLLEDAGIDFRQLIPTVEESRNPSEPAFDYAERLACDKALEVATMIEDNEVVIGCDTIVVLEDTVLEKPVDAADAVKILSILAGRQHTVCSAVALADRSGVLVSGRDLTDVYFHRVATERIEAYVATGEPMDKAGAYGIQGMGAFLVDRFVGNLDTVIGLPRRLLDDLAQRVISAIRTS